MSMGQRTAGGCHVTERLSVVLKKANSPEDYGFRGVLVIFTYCYVRLTGPSGCAALLFPVQPFADAVRDHVRHDGNNKGKQNLHEAPLLSTAEYAKGNAASSFYTI